MRQELQKCHDLIQSTLSHVSHGGPTRAEAEAILAETKHALDDSARATEEVVDHLLGRISVDPRLAYYFDPIGRSMELLTAAHAKARGIDLEEFRQRYFSKLKFERPKCADCGEGE